MKRQNGFLRKLTTTFVFLAFSLTAASPWKASAVHPLITDDTGTQGAGKLQTEANIEYSRERQDGVTEDVIEASAILSYGLWEPVDLVLTVPYRRVLTKDRAGRDLNEGISDLVLELKWRFWEDEDLGLSFALKPGVSLPTGDHGKGLGSGRVSPTLFLIATEKIDPLAFHLNLGYLRNENRLDEERDLWHASLAAELEILQGLKVVGNIGVERNPQRESATDPAFVLGGLVYSVSDRIDLDIGAKGGLTGPEADYSLMGGCTIRF